MQSLLKLVYALLLTSVMWGQTSMQVHVSYGKFLSHSDNEIEITEREKFDKVYGVSVAVQRQLPKRYSLQIEISYYQSSEFEVIAAVATDVTGQGVGENTANLKQESIPLDLTLLFNTGDLSFGAGASIANIQRILHLESSVPSIGTSEDRLSSVAIGINGLVEYRIPLSSAKTVNLIPALKFRYLNAVWFDEKGRNLDNYEQNYFVGQLVLGLNFKI